MLRLNFIHKFTSTVQQNGLTLIEIKVMSTLTTVTASNSTRHSKNGNCLCKINLFCRIYIEFQKNLKKKKKKSPQNAVTIISVNHNPRSTNKEILRAKKLRLQSPKQEEFEESERTPQDLTTIYLIPCTQKKFHHKRITNTN